MVFRNKSGLYSILPTSSKLRTRPIPAPRKSVKLMVQEYEDNVIPLPLQFKDGWKTTPTPRKVKSVVPAAVKRTKIEEKINALKGYTKSFETGVRKDTDPFKQNMETKKSIQYRVTQEMKRVKGLKFVETISITF